jgi:hypothetical protein
LESLDVAADVASVSNSDNGHNKRSILDFVNDAKIALANSIEVVSTLKFF